MTGIDPKRMERRLRRAAEQLGLRPDASLEDVRAAWLRRLPAEDFVPSSELRWALAALLHRSTEGGWEARADEAASVAEEERLRSEVEAFAEKFWNLQPDERRRCWQGLMKECEFAPALRARLRPLEAGLDCVDVVNEAKESKQVVELAKHVRELFVLRHGPRACARQDVLARSRDNSKAWKTAARRLRRVCPKLASLGHDLLDKIGKIPRKPKSLPKPRPSHPAAGIQTDNFPHRRACIIGLIVGIAFSITRIFMTNANRPEAPPTTIIEFPHQPVQLENQEGTPPPEGKKAERSDPQTKEFWEKLKKRFEDELPRREQKRPDGTGGRSDGKKP